MTQQQKYNKQNITKPYKTFKHPQCWNPLQLVVMDLGDILLDSSNGWTTQGV